MACLFGLCGFMVAQAPVDFGEATGLAQAWLEGSAETRAALAPRLSQWRGDIDGVIHALMPKGRTGEASEVGREIKGDSFSVPELQARNEDHPFNFFVPAHYDAAKPHGLILWMHGGGTYKPGKNVKRRSVEGKLEELESGDFIFVAAEACHGVNFPPGAVPDKLANRWAVPASERYLGDLVTEFMHRYHIDPNRVVLWGYSMGGVGAFNHVMRTDRFAAVGIGGGSWTWGTFDTMVNTPVFLWHGKRDSYWNSPTDCRNRMTDVVHSRFAAEILTELGYDHLYVETDGGHNDVNRMDGKWFEATAPFFSGQEGYIVDKVRDPYPPRVIAMTPRGSYEVLDPKTSGDPFRQAESLHDRWVSIEAFTAGPVAVDHLVKTGVIHKAATREDWLNYSAKRERASFQGARIEAENLGGNRFGITTRHVDAFSIRLHPNMVDLEREIEVTTNGVTTRHRCTPSLLTALEGVERRNDWGLVYHASIRIDLKR